MTPQEYEIVIATLSARIRVLERALSEHQDPWERDRFLGIEDRLAEAQASENRAVKDYVGLRDLFTWFVAMLTSTGALNRSMLHPDNIENFREADEDTKFFAEAMDKAFSKLMVQKNRDAANGQ